ncbi:proton channel OtopLc-like [Lineus longissimus]|uniref:proton channel OtopLc-like n=1 Tax=Lineus longissimus TaxID=88925 RepID=UPI00315DA41B
MADMDNNLGAESTDEAESPCSVIHLGGNHSDLSDTDRHGDVEDSFSDSFDHSQSVDLEVGDLDTDPEGGGVRGQGDDNSMTTQSGTELSEVDEDDEDSLDSSSDSEGRRLRNAQDSDSSSSSDGTQIWVPSKPKERKDQTNLNQKSNHQSSSSHSLPPNGNIPSRNPARNSIVSHNSATGKIETTVTEIDNYGVNGDSGINTDSPPLSRSSKPPSFLNLDNIRGQTPPATPCSILKNADEKSPRGISFSDSLFNVLSSLYAVGLVVLGMVLPIAEIFAEPVPHNLFEGFYIFLYSGAILFLIYVYVYLLQNKTARSYRKRKHKRATENDRLTGGYDRPVNRKVGMVVGNHHTGSFYLRLGVVAFGVGSMIHNGLEFSETFETEMWSPCNNILSAVRPMLHLGFTFIQLYFIFLNSKMCIHKYKTIAKFGLMHMIGTNLCVWLRVTVKETLREIIAKTGGIQYIFRSSFNISKSQTQTQTSSTTTTMNDGGVTPNGTDSFVCKHKDMMGKTVEYASPYLYPMTIMYSVIATGILYIMWRNIGNPLTKDVAYDEETLRQKKKYQVRVDCHGSNRGLFCGILILVGAIVTMIVFHVLVQKKEFVDSAVIVVYTTEITLYVLTSLATIFAFIKMRNMKFLGDRDNTLDETLLLISTSGVYVYGLSSLLAGRYHSNVSGGTLLIISGAVVLIEATLQTLFICNGLRRASFRNTQEHHKPGREFVTFLLICNIAMWGTNTFEKLRLDYNPVQAQFYGLLPWSIASHICIPLNILYRFHSTICLANVWKAAYKIKTQ